jgi:hypothetical protein
VAAFAGRERPTMTTFSLKIVLYFAAGCCLTTPVFNEPCIRQDSIDSSLIHIGCGRDCTSPVDVVNIFLIDINTGRFLTNFYPLNEPEFGHLSSIRVGEIPPGFGVLTDGSFVGAWPRARSEVGILVNTPSRAVSARVIIPATGPL